MSVSLPYFSLLVSSLFFTALIFLSAALMASSWSSCHLSQTLCRQEELPRAFPLHPCLCSPKEEMRFLRCCSRLLVLCLLPSRDTRSRSLRLVLIEVIATKGDPFLTCLNFTYKCCCSTFSSWTMMHWSIRISVRRTMKLADILFFRSLLRVSSTTHIAFVTKRDAVSVCDLLFSLELVESDLQQEVQILLNPSQTSLWKKHMFIWEMMFSWVVPQRAYYAALIEHVNRNTILMLVRAFVCTDVPTVVNC